MKILYLALFPIFFILILSNCSTSSNLTKDNISNTPLQEQYAKQSSTSILNMTDLEIIKKTSDYLKSLGEKLTFQETEIIYGCNETESVIYKDEKGQDVIYKGEYLKIKYYPNPNDKNKQKPCIVVFLGEENKVLGYYKEKPSQ